MENTFTRDGDRFLIDGVEVPKAQWEARYAEQQEADDDEDEALDSPDKDPSTGQP